MIDKNDTRKMLSKMRNIGNNSGNTSKDDYNTPKIKNNSMRDMLSIMRNINEQDEDNTSLDNLNLGDDKKNKFDQDQEEFKMNEYFSNNNVVIDYIGLEVYENGVFWGGTIDKQIQFVYKVTKDEQTSGFDINYLEDFDPENPENEEVLEKIETYYEDFYKFWRDNILED